MTQHIDLAGQEIHIGNFVVYAALWSRSAVLKYGRITELVLKADSWRPEKVTPKVKVVTVDCGLRGWELQAGGRPVTLSFLDRMLVIDVLQAPQEVLELLAPEIAA